MPKHPFSEYCSFSRRERIGIACLAGLIILIRCIPYTLNYYFPAADRTDTTGFHDTALQLEKIMRDSAEVRAHRYKKHYPRFSPRPEWRKDSFRRYERPSRERRKFLLDVNTADTLQWDRLPGIGTVLARRIVKFRERLGGFHTVEQVGETYGLADSVFKKIQPLLQLGDVSLRKIDLNDTDEKSLADHPYIRTKLARVIIRYRNNHGPFRQVEALRDVALVDDSIYRKIEKYLLVK